jgi:hypothetical protein
MKTIDGVPESLTHAQIIAAAESLGFDPKLVRSLKLGVGYVEVELYATSPVSLKTNDDPAVHIVFYDTLAKPPADD